MDFSTLELVTALGTAMIVAVLMGTVWVLIRQADPSSTGQPAAGRPVPINLIYYLVAVGFTTFASYGSLLSPAYRQVELGDALQAFARLPLIPDPLSITDVVTNVLLMIPISFFWLGFLVARRQSLIVRLLAAILVFALCVALAVTNEVAQFWSETRVPSKSDVWAQAAGAVIGIGIGLSSGSGLTNWLRTYPPFQRSDRVVTWLLGLYTLGLFVVSMVPFDLTLSVFELGQKLKAGYIEWVPFQNRVLSPSDMLGMLRHAVAYVPIGMLAAVWHNSRTRRLRRPLDAVAFGVLMTLAVEAAQLLAVGRFTSVTDVLLGSAGVVVGVVVMYVIAGGSLERDKKRSASDVTARPLWLRSPSVWALVAVGYACVMTGPFWSPYDFTTHGPTVRAAAQEFIHNPQAGLTYATSPLGLEAAVFRAAWFLPLGVLLGIWSSSFRVSGRVRLFLLGVAGVAIAAMSLVIELGQLAMPSHVARLVDAVPSAVGGWLGLLLAAATLAIALNWRTRRT